MYENIRSILRYTALPILNSNKQQSKIIDDISEYLIKNEAYFLNLFNIDSKLRLAHFVAQIAHESDAFKTTEEYASGKAYEGRKDLGNIYPGDGVRFKGRGLIQVTGRNNYTELNKWCIKNNILKYSLLDNPKLVSDIPLMILSAGWYWDKNNLNKYADQDNLSAISNIINCGRISCKVNGGYSRAQYLKSAKEAMNFSPLNKGKIYVNTGCTNKELVKNIQKLLNTKLNLKLSVDGIYGKATKNAVKEFQKKNKLSSDGIVGEKTYNLLNNKSLLDLI